MYPHIIYGIELWGSASKKLINTLNVMLRIAARSICKAKYHDKIIPLLKKCKMLQINELYELHISKFMHAYMNGDLASPLLKLFTFEMQRHMGMKHGSKITLAELIATLALQQKV